MKRLVSLLLTMVMLFGLLFSQTACAASPPDAISALDRIEPHAPEAIGFSDDQATRANREANPISAAAEKALSQFAYKTASSILNTPAANACYAPVSLYFALALAGSGANGKTQNELLGLLGFASAAKLAEQSGNVYRQLYTDNEITKLKIANSLWLDEEYDGQPVHFKEPFVRNAVDTYYSALYKVDFAKESAGQAMAQWIADATNQTLNPIFEPDPDMIMSIINTVYFRDEWITSFDASLTQPDTFRLADGKTVTCAFMNRQKSLGTFSNGDGFTRSALLLKSNASMIFVLPDADTDLADLLSRPARLKDAFEGGQETYGQITWKIPKFICDSQFELVDTLKALGVRAAYEKTADFSGITDHLAYISSIVQNTHMAIDENGVEASAFSKSDFYGAPIPNGQADMILDRPFLYGIRSATGQLLFIGVCGNPG
ncbi:MAG: serpin family protein [Ruminococcaceae bacterium]|nr:serpin family protein [Oscillospiraceae bacterium]